MKFTINEDFLLENETAKKLFHDYAKEMPIFDYHCHINVDEILEDKAYENITELWLAADHYKWRAMRLFGIDEDYITGSKSDFEKFEKYASVVEYAIGNPIYHWTHLELQRYFDIYEPLTSKNAKEIYERANAMLRNGLTTRKLIKMSNVKRICSTDDPIDTLASHIALKEENYEVDVMPTFRPDNGLEVAQDTFIPWINKLGEVVGYKIDSLAKLKKAYEERMDFFVSVGCKLSDHSLSVISYRDTSENEVAEIFSNAMNNKTIDAESEAKYKSHMLHFLAVNYCKRNWTMQLHLGAIRNNNTKMFNVLGANTGYDSIDDKNIAIGLSKFLDACNNDGLPKTILYTLNPKDNYVLGTMMGNFASSEVPSKVQFGTAWWFNDQRDGMVEQIKAFANLGMIAKFVGMLTDSRSFTSYTRHEYFRRILCNEFGKMVENSEFPQDYCVLGKIVQDISFNNIDSYFYK